jgi:hypothetical protein
MAPPDDPNAEMTDSEDTMNCGGIILVTTYDSQDAMLELHFATISKGMTHRHHTGIYWSQQQPHNCCMNGIRDDVGDHPDQGFEKNRSSYQHKCRADLAKASAEMAQHESSHGLTLMVS